jgi:hypothetical protein
MLAAMIVMIGVVVACQVIKTPEHTAGISTSIQVLSWGQRDALHTDDTTGVSTPSHIIYARVALTAGDTEISLPDVHEPHPAYRVWLFADDDGRVSDSSRHALAADGRALVAIPSHDDELVIDDGFSEEILTVPGPECTRLKPGARCEVTLFWWVHGTGRVESVHGVTLTPATADPTDRAASAAGGGYTKWPTMPEESECSGAMQLWCQ